VLTTLLGYLPVPNLLERLMEMLTEMLPGVVSPRRFSADVNE
jgi:hypothetical protein